MILGACHAQGVTFAYPGLYYTVDIMKEKGISFMDSNDQDSLGRDLKVFARFLGLTLIGGLLIFLLVMATMQYVTSAFDNQRTNLLMEM